MPLTNRDAQDSALAGALDVKEFFMEFMLEWMMPDLRQMQAGADEKALVVWDRMPADLKARYQQADPETYALAEKNIEIVRKRVESAKKNTGSTASSYVRP